MSELNLAEKILTCPYDPSHRVMSFRMAIHLEKCKVNHPDAKVATCKYNSTHIVPETDLVIHHETCKDRYNLDTFMYVPEDCDRNKYPVHNIPVLEEGEETWDDDVAPTYNPQEYCLNNKIFRRLDAASAAKRKTFRLEERIRFQQLSENEKKPGNEDRFEAHRFPGELPLGAPRSANVADPQRIVDDLKDLKISGDRPASQGAVKKEPSKSKENREDDFVLVQRPGRGRGRPASKK